MPGKCVAAALVLAVHAACGAAVPGRVHDALPGGGYVTLPEPIALQAARRDDCAAEALHAVLTYYDRAEDIETLRHELQVPEVKGAFPQQIIQAARERGFRAEPVDGSFQALRREIDAGRPPLLMIRVRGRTNHFLVASGYHPGRRELVCEHHRGRKLVLQEDELQAAWAPCGHLQIELAPDPGFALLEYARGLEADGRHEQALTVYRRILAVVPDETRARIGAGNCLALEGSYREARREYLAAYRRGARDPELLNNLADVSLHVGKDVERAGHWSEEAVASYRGRVVKETDLKRAVAVRKLAFALGTLGDVRLSQGKTAAARTHFEESLRLFGDKQPAFRRRRLNQIAFCCEKLGEPERAAKLRAQAQRLKG